MRSNTRQVRRIGRLAAFAALTLPIVTTPGQVNAADETVTVVSYAGPAVPTVDGDTVTAPVTVTGLAAITDLDVRFDGVTCTNEVGSTVVGLTHSWILHLTISLTSPTGTHVTLAAMGNRADGRNLCLTTFTDEAQHPFGEDFDLPGPYPGSWRPLEPLSAFDGENPNGTWKLVISDDAEDDEGALRAFSLLITTAGAPATPAQPLVYSYSGGAVSIPDGGRSSTRVTTLILDGTYAIENVDVRFEGTDCSTDSSSTTVGLSTPRLADLKITLVSPAQTAVTLLDRPATGDGTNLCQTVFDDRGAVRFDTSGPPADQAPYSATYRPLGNLDDFHGQNPTGEWALIIEDTVPSQSTIPTVLRGFSLIVTDERNTTTTTTWTSGPLAVPDMTPNGAEVAVDVDASGVIADIDLRIDGSYCGTGGESEFWKTPAGINVWKLSELSITLTSPDNEAVVELMRPQIASSYNEFNTGSNMCMATFTDDGPITLDHSSRYFRAPYAGFWKPAEPLAEFNGRPAAGRWILTVTDSFRDGAHEGSLNEFSLLITTASAAPATTAVPTTAPSGPGSSPYPTPTLPATGIGPRPFVGIALALLLVGVVLVMARRARF